MWVDAAETGGQAADARYFLFVGPRYFRPYGARVKLRRRARPISRAGGARFLAASGCPFVWSAHCR